MKPLTAKVITPERTLYEGELKAITAINDAGIFSILPQHTNFITIIYQQITLYPPDSEPQQYTIDQGVVSVKNNHVDIYIGVMVIPEPAKMPKPVERPR